jgi:poly(beta-D-mannuronate) lyase
VKTQITATAMALTLVAAGFVTVSARAESQPAPAAKAASAKLVRTQAEYAAALLTARPGDTIVLADGEWRDFQIVFTGKGEPGRPIVLTGQTPGKVHIVGRSNLRMAGEHLVVQNLVFRDGWSPTGEVVSFRRTRSERAVHSRVTGVVIDAFNKPDRAESDNWVALYGHHNRFDHNHLAGKTNAGATLVVVRDAEQGLENRHLIDHNYFGHRPNLGTNGGETIRIGTSHDSQSDSFTTVENNWFEQCDGEIEIVSNKSGANVYRGNVFHQSQGALTLRHGDGVLVERNVFLGGGKPNTGGVRVINRNQTVRDNYMEGLQGEGFASALTVMYGVPNSPLNRYVQVDNAMIANNTIIDARSIFIGAGADDERSARPINSRLVGNLIVNRDGHDPLRVNGDPSGLAPSGNVQSPVASPRLPGAFKSARVSLSAGADGVMRPEGLEGVGAPLDLKVIPRTATGVPWYPKESRSAALDSGARIEVRPGEDTLTAAVAAARPGDRLSLRAGDYFVNQVLRVTQPLTVEGPEGASARIAFSRPTLFEIDRGGALKLRRLSISGAEAPDAAGNAVVRAAPTAFGYTLEISDSRIADLTVNRAFDVVSAAKGSLADRIIMTNTTVESVSGSVLALNAETDDRGAYNAEQVEVRDSRFRNVTGEAIDLYRGGTDESTFGPRLVLAGADFQRVGAAGDAPAAVRLHGVQVAEIRGNRFRSSGPVRFFRQVGEPRLVVAGNTLSDTPPLVSNVAAIEAAR